RLRGAGSWSRGLGGRSCHRLPQGNGGDLSIDEAGPQGRGARHLSLVAPIAGPRRVDLSRAKHHVRRCAGNRVERPRPHAAPAAFRRASGAGGKDRSFGNGIAAGSVETQSGQGGITPAGREDAKGTGEGVREWQISAQEKLTPSPPAVRTHRAVRRARSRKPAGWRRAAALPSSVLES